MYKQIKANNQGFTIIEVMIVLAIAALILIIVLLAVPALQRNAKNTTAKNDASSIAGAVSDYESNNNGGIPTTSTSASPLTGGTYEVGASGTGITQANTTIAGSTTVNTVASGGTFGAPAANPAPDTIDVYYGGTCNTTSPFTPGPSSTGVAILYSIATGGTNTWGCIQG